MTCFKDIPGLPGYRAGDDGSIWSCLKGVGSDAGKLTEEWRELKPCRHPHGHMMVNLRGSTNRWVHRFVLEAFVGPCPPGMECRHLDGNPANNRLENLVWGTREENAKDRVRHETDGKGERNSFAILTESKVREALAMHRAGVNTLAITRHFKVSRGAIRAILNGSTWNHVTGLPLMRRKPVALTSDSADQRGVAV